MKKRKMLIALFMAVTMAFGVAASGCRSCNDDDDQSGYLQPDGDSVSLDTNTLALNVGDSYTLIATVLPTTANKTVTWSSSNYAVATITNGIVTAVAKGTATITVTSAANKTADCIVTVSEAGADKDPDTPSISLNPSVLNIGVGDSHTLVATVLPATADKTVIWSSDNENVATVENGTVKGVSIGTAIITAKSAAGKTATCTVSVSEKGSAADSISLNTSGLSLFVNDSATLVATVLPVTADQKVEWSSNNTSVALVLNGKVTAVAEGSATITAKSAVNKTATCLVTVSKRPSTEIPAESVEICQSAATLEIGSSLFLSASINPSTSTEKLMWSSSDPSVATVDTDGKVLAKAAGKTVISATASGGKKATCSVTVNAPAIIDSEIIENKVFSESATFSWKDSNASKATVQYKLSNAGETAYVTVDKELIRQTNSTTARVDVLGLKGNEKYDFKITTSANQTLTAASVTVSAYDRSGYAHFNYSDGVGAYNDDGTIKNNVLVIYLTNDNKNDVLDYCYVDGKKVNITQYVTDSSGTVYKGIGEIINNRRYAGNDRKNVGIWKLTQVYGGVSLRVIGQVSNSFINGKVCEITGLTDYDSADNGGTVGDSGGMARMVNARNVTVEGVGEDAVIKGWGFHFVASYKGGKQNDPTVGKGFEARNITFTNYPEDALGMEGEQGTGLSSTGEMSGASSTASPIISPVERCWIHNNVFLQGGGLIEGAESDKNEGDGSCDFKRGRYYTFSYNYMENCHKTNLLGSSDSSLQFDISFHHNWYNGVQSRQPLTRNSNVHYYNNYISGATDYVMSPRASCYIFAEANYFYGCKNITSGAGGVVKGYGNVYNGNYSNNAVNEVAERTQKVNNSCKYQAGKIDYSAFDTNSEIFYYDAVNKKSDCYITDAVTARKDVMVNAGVHGFGKGEDELAMNENTPTGSVSVPKEGLTVNLNNISSYSGMTGAAKAKGQALTFRLAQKTDISVTTSGGVLADSNGVVYADQFTQFDGTLPAGIYFISAQALSFENGKLGGKNLKEVTITALSFRPAESDEELAAPVIKLIDAIPENITESAQTAIKAARDAYNALSASAKALVTNYSKLIVAEAEFENIAINSINGKITALEQVDVTVNEAGLRQQLGKYNEVKELYEAVSADKQSSIVGYSKVTEGIALLSAALKPYDVKLMIGELPVASAIKRDDGEKIKAARAAYDALTAAQKDIVGDISKLTAAETAYDALPKAIVAIIGHDKDGNLIALPDGVTISGTYKSGLAFEYDGVEYYDPLKMESKTVITITLTEDCTVTLHFAGSNSHIKIDGCNGKDEGHSTDSEGDLVLTLKAGTHTIEKGSGSNPICYIIIEPN